MSRLCLVLVRIDKNLKWDRVYYTHLVICKGGFMPKQHLWLLYQAYTGVIKMGNIALRFKPHLLDSWLSCWPLHHLSSLIWSPNHRSPIYVVSCLTGQGSHCVSSIGDRTHHLQIRSRAVYHLVLLPSYFPYRGKPVFLVYVRKDESWEPAYKIYNK